MEMMSLVYQQYQVARVFSYQVSDNTIASVSATGSVTIVGAGMTSIVIDQAGDLNFLTASKTITLYVLKLIQ